LLFENRPQVFELVEEVPDVIAGALLPVPMQVGNVCIIAVAVEGFFRRSFNDDHQASSWEILTLVSGARRRWY
jgi:hypothetical protein